MTILERIQDSLFTVISQIMGVLPNLMGALVLLLVGWILAKVVSGLIAKLLSRIGLDTLADKLNNTDFFQEVNLEIRPINIIKQFLYWTLMLIFVLSAAETLGLQIVTEQVSALVDFIPKLFTSIIILALGFYLADVVKKFVANACKSFGIPAWKLISSAVFYILLIALSITALNQAGIDTDIITFTVFIVIGGSVLAFSLAYGIAARDMLASILTAYYTKYKYQPGQIIEIDNYKGEITQISNVSLTLDTGNHQVVFPMNRLLADKVIIHPKSAKTVAKRDSSVEPL